MLELPALYSTIIGGLIVAVITGISGLAWSLLKKRAAIRKWKEKEEVKGKSELGADRFKLVKSSTFIPTMGQTEGPHDSDNITISYNRFDLADKLLKDIFAPNEGVWKKRYAILGGTGMGKSTFSAYFFYKYINQYKYNNCKYPIFAKYLGQKNVLNDLRKMSKDSNVNQSILILDALDENKDAVKDTKVFLDKIEEITDKYKIVILTSRTQFFSNKGSEPTKGTVQQNSHTYRFLSWDKIYISPFSEEETIQYLEHKYKIPSKEYSKAKRIADLSKDLVMRPMVLSYMDALLELADNKELSIAEIYYKIIDEWLSKECDGYSLDKSDLFTFSKELALFLYEKWEQTSDSYITEEEYNNFISLNGYQNIPYSFKGRSLINRRSDGSIKFSHKSFWEFFLAICSFEYPGKIFNINGFEMATIFSKELYKFFMNDVSFEGIHYYRPNLFSSKDNLTEMGKILEDGKRNNNISGDESTWNNLFPNLITKYWESIIQRLPYQFRLIRSLGINDPAGLYMKDINDNLYKIQEFFFMRGKPIQNELISHIDNFHERLTFYSDIFTARSLMNPKYKMGGMVEETIKDYVAFPFTISFSDQLRNKFLSKNYIYVGTGFNDNKSLYSFIDYVIRNSRDMDVICIYRDGNDLDCHVKFIKGLSEKLNPLPPCIIVQIQYNNSTTIYYLINEQTETYTSERIKTCISNMINNKSHIAKTKQHFI